jgi:hypothetical protein
MDIARKIIVQKKKTISICNIVFLLFSIQTVVAQVPDPNQGLRADWLRGTWGINWKPVNLYNGGHEGLSIEPFLNQISHIKTIDYIQVHLGESSIKSSLHMGPHPLLESFWEGDTDGNGDPINLVVPRASFGEDPFLEIVKDIRAAGMGVMVYVNSSNMLSRDGPDGSNPDYIPNITERWKAWCDTNTEAQAFIASQPYHSGVWNSGSETYVNAESQFPERKYMFCYAEFVLKVYAIRYGALIDAWCFDSGSWMGKNGDSQTNGVYEDQMIFNAFKAACHAGNPNAALSFQNSPERDTEELNPFSEAVHADDYMFGHPYNGGRDGGSHTVGDPPLYDRNYAHIEKIKETNGNVHSGIDAQTWTWDDKVVGHYDPPMSTSSWNGGNTPALTDAEFNLWNLEAMQYGGAISWGLPLVGKSSGDNNKYIANDWALAQLNGMDAHLMTLESPGAPNWARLYTNLHNATIGIPYSQILTEGIDFWDPEGDAITTLVAEGTFPTWLKIAKIESGKWKLSGTPTELTNKEYNFNLKVSDATSGSERPVTLNVAENTNPTVSNVQVQATPNTNYGIESVATLYSELQTAPDGLATYRLAIEVTPSAGKAVISGNSGGISTEKSWGLGDGTDSNRDDLFWGNENEWVQSINNIQIIDFQSNDGDLSIDDFSVKFKSISVVNGQSPNDFVSIKVGTSTTDVGRLTNQLEIIDLEVETSLEDIIDFSIGTGNELDTNKWAVEGITAEVKYQSSNLSAPIIDEEVPFVLFPNPVNEELSFTIPLHSVKISEITGKRLITEVIQIQNIDVSDLTPGIYIIKGITVQGTQVYKKFIKK